MFIIFIHKVYVKGLLRTKIVHVESKQIIQSRHSLFYDDLQVLNVSTTSFMSCDEEHEIFKQSCPIDVIRKGNVYLEHYYSKSCSDIKMRLLNALCMWYKFR